MTRKGENIYKRKDGRWEGRYIKKRDSEGRIIYGYTYGKRYIEVKSKLIILKAQYYEPNALRIFNGDLEEWSVYWLYHYKKSTIKQSTFFNYKWLIKKYILPYIGEKRIGDLTNEDIRSYIETLEKLGLSHGTTNNIFILLKKILEEAENQNIISSNPCRNIKLTRKKYRNKVPVALTMNEQKQLEYFAFKEKGCSAIILALYSGLRIGEISGLKWSDIDFENGTIGVNRTISRVSSHSEENKTEILIGFPKTDQSSRVVPLAENLKKYLLAKKALSHSSHVVSCKNKMTEPRVIRYRFKKVVEASGIRNIHFHSLRHTFATRCIEKRVDISSLSKLLGHTSAKMTLDTYADSVLESRQKAIFKIDQLMNHQLE
ncbi:hypothetical protein ATZ33_06170 [Enterococcus silesiacus]|uniref:Site-specific integrase n=1 Tax=Enterococcus silesiacus TaxID=332949 RepID=A0A0S3K9T7_9ENTE|nr:site-specific integrase [Enterococcus silesiacus]ALS00968.1 hypothetical protein ATZ33_06170 [Enterococcus silesiacus]OJG89967.1 hypothetical protein RV15_GL001533 [Enterococcus silesiacus]